MLDVNNLGYASEMTILFQRGSVIFLDLVYAYGIKKCLNAMATTRTKEKHFIAALLLGNIGLIMVDHIHFQYNSFLFGILLLSFASVIENKFLMSAFWFAVLLNFKHIYLYVAPAYAVCFFKMYSLSNDGRSGINLKRMIVRTASLGCIVLSVTLAAFGPFVYHLEQITQRLFPFKRGLSHAYWAPNFWAIYNFADKILAVVLKKTNRGNQSSTTGLVQNFEHAVLPSITPLHTFILTLATMLPFLFKVLFSDRKT